MKANDSLSPQESVHRGLSMPAQAPSTLLSCLTPLTSAGLNTVPSDMVQKGRKSSVILTAERAGGLSALPSGLVSPSGNLWNLNRNVGVVPLPGPQAIGAGGGCQERGRRGNVQPARDGKAHPAILCKPGHDGTEGREQAHETPPHHEPAEIGSQY